MSKNTTIVLNMTQFTPAVGSLFEIRFQFSYQRNEKLLQIILPILKCSNIMNKRRLEHDVIFSFHVSGVKTSNFMS